MSCGGTSLPRKKLGVGGLAVRCAQSSGEWPGSRRTFREGRAVGARVDEEGAREELGGARGREGGARRVDAADGGGRRAVEGLDGGLKVDGALGRGGGGIREEADGVGLCEVFAMSLNGVAALSSFGCWFGLESVSCSRPAGTC